MIRIGELVWLSFADPIIFCLAVFVISTCSATLCFRSFSYNHLWVKHLLCTRYATRYLMVPPSLFRFR